MKVGVGRRTTGRRWAVLAGGVVVCVLALAATFTGGTGSESDADDAGRATLDVSGGQPAGQSAPALGLERRDPNDPLTMGPVDAPITLVVYSDYQCPFCAAWSEQTLPKMQGYAESGELRIEWRDVNIMSDVSEVASAAAYAAALQGRFWEYHELLFPGGETRAASGITTDRLVAFAVELGLDRTRFVEDMGASDTLDAVTRNAREGRDAGVFSTPAFVLDGQPILGAQPTGVFVDAVERALADGS